ncbi:MAG: InlB B-repeat-containing protein [Candidatus Symbiothrix sp.]|jgi:uncharacterized protein YjdB|nr:InlB B-repeat-containing protein [Candidatus Symbiothrix sp.]
MKTQFSQLIRGLFFTTAALFVALAVQAQSYTGYDYFEYFNSLPTVKGTLVNNAGACAVFEWLDAPANTNGVLRFNAAAQSGTRNATLTLSSPPAAATKKLIVEFDWYPAAYAGGAGDEGQIRFRNGTGDANVLFTVYNLRGSDTEIGIAVGPLNGSGAAGKAATINAAYRTSLTNTTLSRWYHVKAEVYKGQRICFTITGDEGYERTVMLPVPSGTSIAQVTNIYIDAIRSSNVTWNTVIDNIGIKIADTDPDVPATSVNLTSQWDVIAATGGTSTLSASVLPFDVTNHAITWSVDDPSLATLAASPYPSWTNTLTGANGGSGDVTVTATSATGGILATKVIHVSATGIPLTNITISGATEVSVGNTITLSKTVAPGNATNQNVVWSSSDVAVATINASTGVVTGVSAGDVTITATAADGGGAYGVYDVSVIFNYITSIEIWGARRIFYTATPATTASFALSPQILPATASNKTLSWSSDDVTIATVTASGQVSLVGGFGITHIKASTEDGSGVEGRYYIEVAATNPYNGFSDFESSVAPFSATPAPVSFQGTRALYFNADAQSGGRNQTFTLSSAITGGVLNLRFDWFAGRVRNSFKDSPSLPEINSGTLSIQDDAGTPNMILTFIFADTDEETDHIAYFTGNYVSSTGSKPEGIGLENVTRLDAWYTLDITIDYLANECSFIITERDNPTRTQAVTAIPLSLVFPPKANVKSLFINGLRTATNNLTITSAIDNFAYKVLDPTLPTYEVTGLSLDGLDQVVPGGSILIYPRIAPGNAINKNLTWTSSAPAVATVTPDANGRVIVNGLTEGEAVIRATSDENPAIFAEKTITVAQIDLPKRQIEKLSRGLVAVPSGSNVFLSWRLLGTDPDGIEFNLYKNDDTTPLNPSPLDAAHTDYLHIGGNASNTYSVAVLVNSEEIYRSEPTTVWAQQYLNIPVQMPTTGHLPDGGSYTNYTIYDGSTADLDGDGEYDIVFLWAPANLQDNSNAGQTGNVYIDAYKLDGTKLWGSGKYIDLGSNIRAGAHYSPFLVFDFDGDGKAEIAIRTSDGTKDTEGQLIGEDVVHANADGFVLTGPEFVSIFEGATGKVLASAPYDPPRGNPVDWGDGIANRADRFLASVAYLDGIHPSAVMCRGYYTRTTLAAWDWDGVNLTERWLFDSDVSGKKYGGQGNHNMSVGDVDGDGKDEIIYGSLTIDDDGSPMYTTGLGHGDAMHVGKLDPTRPGLQMMGVHENPFPYGMEMHDLLTGDLIWSVLASGDIGRGVAADIDPNYPGVESWSSGGLGTYAANGTKLSGSSPSSMNMAIYWDGDTGRELFDGSSSPSVTKINPTGTAPNKSFGSSNVITFSGASTNGGTKNNPCLQADILGDWREEVILRASDNSALRIYTTITATSHTGNGTVPSSGIPTLMHNKEYRLAVAWQNGGYNQPPHADFFLGYNMPDVVREEGAAFTVTLDPNSGVFADATTDPKEIKTVTGAYFGFPDISKDESVLLGWFLPDGTAYNPTELYSSDITLTAKWQNTLFFDANGGTVEIASKPVIYGEEVSVLPTPFLLHFAFLSWNTAQAGTGDTYTGTTVYSADGNTTLYAQWMEIFYTVTFEGEGVGIDPLSLAEGEIIVRPEDPVRAGYLFDGWYYYGELWNFNYSVYSDMTLVAQWTAIPTYTVTFEGESIGNIATQTVMEGEAIVRPNDPPVRSGYLFIGWYYNGNLWNFDNPIYSDMTLVGLWKDITGIIGLDGAELRIYPNPTYDYVVISGLIGNETISIIDMTGRKVLTHKATQQREAIVLGNLQQGHYIIRIANDNTIKFSKLIIEK